MIGQKGATNSGYHVSTAAAFYMRLMALWHIPSEKSDLSPLLPFIQTVKVWVPCHNSLWSLPVNIKERFFSPLFTSVHSEQRLNRGRYAKKGSDTSSKERETKVWESYSVLSLHMHLWVLQLPGNQHNSSVSPGKLKLNKTLFLPLSYSPFLPCHERDSQSITQWPTLMAALSVHLINMLKKMQIEWN